MVDDWRVFRDMRLEAVRTNPSVFLRSYETEAAQPNSYWQDCLSNPANAVFILYHGDNPIGLTGAFPDHHSPLDTINFGMSFIRPEYRGRGLSRLFYEARLNWAREQPGIKKITTAHRDGNDASKATMLKHGFKLLDKEEKTFAYDKGISWRYELKI